MCPPIEMGGHQLMIFEKDLERLEHGNHYDDVQRRDVI